MTTVFLIVLSVLAALWTARWAAHRYVENRRLVLQPSWSEPQCSGQPPQSSFQPGKFLMGVLCVIYIISPIDLMPEAFLGPFGLGDDLVAFFLAIRNFKASRAKD